MSTPLEIVIPTNKIVFGNSVVSDKSTLKLFDPADSLSFKISIYDNTKPFSATALALNTAVLDGSFTQAHLENFLADASNNYAFHVDFTNLSGTFDNDFNKYYNWGTLRKVGSDIFFIPKAIDFDLPSFVQFSGTGFGTNGGTGGYGQLVFDLTGASATNLNYSIYNYSFEHDPAWYQDLDSALSSLISAGTDINKYFTAFSNFLVANEELNRDDYNFRYLNFKINPSQTVSGITISDASAYVTNATLNNGTIKLDFLANNLLMNIDSVDFAPGPVAETLSLSPVLQSTSLISITPTLITETYFMVFLKPGFSSYPLALINQISSTNPSDQVNAVRSLLNDNSVLISADVEFATEQDLNGDGITDGENFTFGIKDIQYVDGTIKITPDKPTNFIVKTGFSDFHYGSAVPDLIYGLDGNDNISVSDDDDSVHGGAGNDTIDGGNGIDSAYFQGAMGEYSITSVGGIITVVDSKPLRDDTDTLQNIENLVFSDKTIAASSITPPTPINGSSLSETLNGTSSNDVIYGFGGDDFLYGARGSDTINGGDGYDIAFQELDSPLYLMTYHGNSKSITLFNDYDGTPETDTLISIEKIQFADISFDTSFFVKAAALSKNDISQLAELYIASFNRAPDAFGLSYWSSRYYDGMTLEQIAKSFFVQPETVAAYPSHQATANFVTTVYNNVLSRGPDQAGLDYWVKQIDNGVFSKDVFLLAIINGAKASTGSAVDRQTLTNKTTVGMDFAFSEGLSNVAWGKDVMSGVTSVMSTVDAAKAKTDAYGLAASSGATAELTVKMVGVWDGI